MRNLSLKEIDPSALSFPEISRLKRVSSCSLGVLLPELSDFRLLAPTPLPILSRKLSHVLLEQDGVPSFFRPSC